MILVKERQCHTGVAEISGNLRSSFIWLIWSLLGWAFAHIEHKKLRILFVQNVVHLITELQRTVQTLHSFPVITAHHNEFVDMATCRLHETPQLLVIPIELCWYIFIFCNFWFFQCFRRTDDTQMISIFHFVGDYTMYELTKISHEVDNFGEYRTAH